MRAFAAGWLARLFKHAPEVPIERVRWVVLDCESSGLDPRADRLLAIGAIDVEGGRIGLGSGFSVVLRQETPSDASNIVIHGISGSAQLAGTEPREALMRFADYADECPLVAFHAPFDRTLLGRAYDEAGLRLQNRWLDLAALAPALRPEHAQRCKALDDWLGIFGIENPRRHDALSDAFATGLLFQVLVADARAQGVRTCAQLQRAAQEGRWLSAGR